MYLDECEVIVANSAGDKIGLISRNKSPQSTLIIFDESVNTCEMIVEKTAESPK